MQEECDVNTNNNSKYHNKKGRREKNLVFENKVKDKGGCVSNNSIGIQKGDNKIVSKNKKRRDVGINSSLRHLSIIYLNARSLRNKMDELRMLAVQLNPDIIGVVETWLTDDNFDCEINIVNYNFIRLDRKNELKAKGGGVVIYFKQELSVVETTSNYNSNIDHIWIKF